MGELRAVFDTMKKEREERPIQMKAKCTLRG